jgi:hypothetical protein
MIFMTELSSAAISIQGLDTLVDSGSAHVNFMEGLIALTAVGLLFGTPLLMLLALLRFSSRRQQRQHEVILKLADKGLPVPEELFNAHLEPGRDLRLGIITLSAAVGVTAFLYLVGAEEGAGLGLIPFSIGVGYLIVWYIERRQNAA